MSICAGAFMLAACNGTTNSPSPPAPRPPGSPETVLHSFGSGSDGTYPQAGLINVNGTLYGTTAGGGAYVSLGTVYSITPSGTETVLYSFVLTDGANPYAGLLNVKGTFYGTTQYGGANDGGTAFSLTTSGAQTVLHSFGIGRSDGEGPSAGLINVNGALYGTTVGGGANNSGTVFKITSGGKYKLLYSFGKSLTDGSAPQAGLVDVNGTLYGTTYGGGAEAFGTVFSISPFGKEAVLHSFGTLNDGTFPQDGLLNVKGTLYGTTEYGGASNVGTVFAITPGGAESVLYNFAGGSDGAQPRAGLIGAKGTLFGTTSEGGTSGKGTVFALTSGGTETVLYSFQGGTDGANPLAGLLNVGGTLYGTTYKGGANGKGTVFSLTGF
ncbi:MAG TPA: choice-of-anchor tandem repeat GloVer-containing protein [Candidatus Cybelea sp.]|jgi:uncharacterized repeat protein (TIGR03803 family)|nr:choice-of-anchor tandem repeat GloVer-containing protein [Candidatus Cybelea sp.]